MKRVAAFTEVDDDTESLFDYDVDRVRFYACAWLMLRRKAALLGRSQ